MNDKLKISQKTNYHIYILNKNECDNIIKNKDNYIGFFLKNQSIKKGDVVILYLKDRMKSGFYGIVQLDTNVSFNDTNDKNNNKIVKISSDTNMNRYYAKLCFKKKFLETIDPESIIKYVSSDATGFKNATSFKQKFVTKLNALIGFEVYGKKIMTKLMLEDEDIFIRTESEKEKEKENEDDEEDEEGEKNEEQEQEDEEQEQEQEDEESEDQEENKKEKEENEDEDEEEEIEKEPEPGFIPIMVVPCNEFKLPKKNREKYFMDHYTTCNKCDITNNNNNSELTRIFNKDNIEIYELTSSKHYYFNPALSAYYGMDNYEPPDIQVRPFARIIYINNGHDDYDKCFLITLCDV